MKQLKTPELTKPVPLSRLAREIGVVRRTVCRWILEGLATPDGERVQLEAVRLGRRWFVTREALNKFNAALAESSLEN